MIKYKSKKSTDKDFPHVDVYVDNMYIGYILDEKYPFPNTYNPINRWGLIPNGMKFHREFISKTKKEVIAKIEKYYN